MAKKSLPGDSPDSEKLNQFGIIPLGNMNELPEHLRDRDSRSGYELVESEDVYTPRLALAQSNTPQVKKSSPNYIDGLTEGDFFHSIKGTNYGPGPLFITPIFMFKSGVRLDKDGQLICRSDNSRDCSMNGPNGCLCRKWGDDGSRPVCNMVYNFPVVLYGDEDFQDGVILSMKSTAIGVAKDWVSKMKATGKDMFAGVWKIWSVPEGDGQYNWMNMRLEAAGWAPPDVFEKAEALHEALLKMHKSGKLKVDMTGETVPTAPSTPISEVEFDETL